MASTTGSLLSAMEDYIPSGYQSLDETDQNQHPFGFNDHHNSSNQHPFDINDSHHHDSITPESEQYTPLPVSILKHSANSHTPRPQKCVAFHYAVKIREYEQNDDPVLYTSCEEETIHPDDHFCKYATRGAAKRALKRELRLCDGDFRTCQLGAREFEVNEDSTVSRQTPHKPLYNVVGDIRKRLHKILSEALLAGRALGEGSFVMLNRLRMLRVKREVDVKIDDFVQIMGEMVMKTCARIKVKEALEEMVEMFEAFVKGEGDVDGDDIGDNLRVDRIERGEGRLARRGSLETLLEVTERMKG